MATKNAAMATVPQQQQPEQEQEQQTTAQIVVVKRPGPPVPPRPLHAAAANASLLKTQRDSLAAKRVATQTATTTKELTIGTHPVIQKKPTLVNQLSAVGRTLVYKSPSLSLQKKQEERERRANSNAIPTPAGTTGTAIATATKQVNGTPASKPPLKLRKAPDVPTVKSRADVNNKPAEATPPQHTSTANIVIVKSNSNSNSNSSGSGNGIGNANINRHNSLTSPKQTPMVNGLKDTRFSLGKVDFERAGLQPTTQPLPKPRKIVHMPVATIDAEDLIEQSTTPATTTSAQASTSIFRRSKTTLDNITTRAHVTTINTGAISSGNGFLSGKTVEIKNNIRNAAERLFSEIIVSQSQKQQQLALEQAAAITKHERAIQHQALLEQELAMERQKRAQQHQQQQQQQQILRDVTIVSTQMTSGNNCTRININGGNNNSGTTGTTRVAGSVSNINTASIQAAPAAKTTMSAGNTPEKKTTFHEMLISELAAMRGRSCSLEHLPTANAVIAATQITAAMPTSNLDPQQTPLKVSSTSTSKSTTTAAPTEVRLESATQTLSLKSTPTKAVTRKRYISIEDQDPDTEDVDADNVEDADGDCDDDNDDDDDDDDDITPKVKNGKSSSANTPRKRCPSGCSSDSSPYGTERSSTRIRTADWIEVGDNGKQVTMTSCHISLEDSGLEDEERLDELSSSGVGDSWDSVKEAENEKRCRNVKRVKSITGLPPLPKSLSGINKMLGSDSGLISDVDVNAENNINIGNSNPNNNALNNNNIISNKLECQKVSNNQLKDSNDNESDISTIKEYNGNENSTSNSNSNSNSNTNTNSTTTATNTPTKINTTPETATGTTSATTPTIMLATSTTTTTPPTTATTATALTGSTLDAQIATLRKEMYGLRQLDLSLLSQLWALNDSIQEFRTMLEEQEAADEDDDENDDEELDVNGIVGDPDLYTRHSPTPSSYDSVSSEGGGEGDVIIKTAKQMKESGTIPKVITMQPKLTKSNTMYENFKPTMSKLQGTPPEELSHNVTRTMSSATMHQQQQKPPLPKALDVKPLPRMRSAPPPPPNVTSISRKAAAPPRPT